VKIIVQKFGGSSVADAAKIKAAASKAVRACRQNNKVVMVISAMGDTTDDLIALAQQITDNPPKREMDQLLSTGEQQAIALMAMAIHAAGEQAISFTGGQVGLVTDNVFTKARIKSIDEQRIRERLDRGEIVVVAGFQGVDEQANITTLGRGGSDTTAVALAAVLKADVCEIWKDVDGVFTADPRIVPEARKVDRISYEEMLELASLGAGVLHSRALEFGMKYDVPIHVRNSMHDEPGTIIGPEVKSMEDIVVSGATVKKDLYKVTVRHVPDRPGVCARIFSALGDHHIVVDDIIQNVSTQENGGAFTDVSFTVAKTDLADTKKTADRLTVELGAAGHSDSPVARVSVVGVGMRSHTGVAGKMFRALADADINIHAITTSEIKISVILAPSDADNALRAVHRAFGLSEGPAEASPARSAAKRK
jgi:aspartate kinase